MVAVHGAVSEGMDVAFYQFVTGQHGEVVVAEDRGVHPGPAAGFAQLLTFAHIAEKDPAGVQPGDVVEVILDDGGLHFLEGDEVHKEIHVAAQFFDLPGAEDGDGGEGFDFDLGLVARLGVGGDLVCTHGSAEVMLGHVAGRRDVDIYITQAFDACAGHDFAQGAEPAADFQNGAGGIIGAQVLFQQGEAEEVIQSRTREPASIEFKMLDRFSHFAF